MSNVLKESVFGLREKFLEIEKEILALKGGVEKGMEGEGEAFDNIMLAYRHAEDARMRLGKVIQAIEGGVSCYSK